MNKAYLLLASALLVVSCQKEVSQGIATVSGGREGTITWTFNAVSTKATIGDDKSFAWTAGDAIKVWNAASQEFVTFTDRYGSGVFTAEASRNANFTRAFYPASSVSGTGSISLPSSYDDVARAANAFPMEAFVNSSNNILSFRHLGAILRLRMTDVEKEIKTLSISSPDGSISGEFTVTPGTVYFSDDFEWLQSWTSEESDLDPVGGNALGSTAGISLWNTALEDARNAFSSRGYEDLNQEAKTLYLMQNYLKFGRNNVQSGLRLPAVTSLGAVPVDAVLSFDWCAHVGANGSVDAVSLVVELEGPGVCTDSGAKVSNPFVTTQQGGFGWQGAIVQLHGITSSTVIKIRPSICDSSFAQSGYHRYHLDNLLLAGCNSIAIGSGNSAVTIPLSLNDHSTVDLTLAVPTGEYAFSIKFDDDSQTCYEVTTDGAKQLFERGKIYDLGAINARMTRLLFDVDVQSEDYDVESEDQQWN